MKIYVSSGAFLSRQLPEILILCDRYGLDLELGPSIPFMKGMEKIIEGLESCCLFLVHNYFPPPQKPFVLNLASTDVDTWEKSLDHCLRAIDLCVKIGSPFYSVHAGFAMHLNPEDLGNPSSQRAIFDERSIPRFEAYSCFLRAIKIIGTYARERGLGLLVENNVSAVENLDPQNKSPFLLSSHGELLDFLEEVKDLGVRLLLDVGHAKVSAHTFGECPEVFFESLSPYVEALHLSENDGLRDSNCAFNESSWFLKYIKNFKEKPIVIEVYGLSIEELLKQHKFLSGYLQ